MKQLSVLLLLLCAGQVWAESEKLGSPGYEKWKKECSSCHVAYPPHMLSSENWQELMGRLDRHFNSNAMLDAKDNRHILDFLKRFAGSGERYSSASLRISDTPWFVREHRVISEKEWKLPAVKTRSNCSACHGKVVLGD
ncbi:MAG: cytochrome C [Nitrosomonadales bacterium]|nr:cytochrome C [Nitrosomonadales bacterium]